ncbi:hypothetical protein LXA43DRAFT_749193 [Ganoderma leucocontextum]|nr:hypothetical protein LXA43DRAFT_749193 [Ganoderma leucocontextum]
MSFHDFTNEDVDDAANLLRSLMERLKHSNYYRDIPRASDAALENVRDLRPQAVVIINTDLNGAQLRRFDELLAEASSVTRQYLNTTVPINRCPGEILSEIFALSATEKLSSFSPGHGRVSFVVVQKLRPITLVCRSWRYLALSTPSLWSDVVFDRRWRKDLSSRCLALAKTVPLRVHARQSPRASCGEIMRMFKGSSDCVREAYLRVSDLGWHDIVDSLPARPPLLTHLTIDGGSWINSERTYTTGEHYFGGLVQGLQRLSLHGNISLPTDRFPNLTHLMMVTGRGPYTLRIILSVLSNMPTLQVISLSIEIEEGSTAKNGRESDAIVEPTHLRQFTLKDSPPFTVGALLPMIKFPSTCLVQLVDEQRLEDLVSIVGLLYAQDFAQNLTRLRILPDAAYNDGDEDNDTSLYLLELLNDAGTSGLSLGIYEPYSGLWTAYDRARVTDTLVEFLSSLAGAKLVSNIKELWVHNWTDLVNERLLTVIPPIHTLGLVLARQPYVRTEIPPAIGRLTEAGTVNYCPNLTSLYVYTCGAKDVDRARMVATARKDVGHPLHRLAIECENKKSGVQSRALELEGLVHELSVTVEEKTRGWWKPCAIPDRWSRHGPFPWPDWQQ